jgi:hypothetical protein
MAEPGSSKDLPVALPVINQIHLKVTMTPLQFVNLRKEAMPIAPDAMEHLATAHEFVSYAERNTAEGLTPQQIVRILGETKELLQEVWISIFADETGHTCLDERIRRHMNKSEYSRIVKELENEVGD